MGMIEEELIGAMQRGRISFAIQPTPGQPIQANSMLYVSTENWAARAWTINLCRMRFSGGVLPSTVFPTDNQVNGGPAPGGFVVKVTWGTDGVLEDALVDYPWGGCTFMVQAATVRVDLVTPFSLSNDAQPLLQGFLTPAQSFQPVVAGPTLTVQAGSVGPLSTSRIAVPSRATAYRIATQSPATAAGDLTGQQQDAFARLYKTDGGFPPGPAPQLESQGNDSGYYWLHRLTTVLGIQNINATNTNNVIVQFLLDMG